jgi:Ca-activated chloride channel homolog
MQKSIPEFKTSLDRRLISRQGGTLHLLVDVQAPAMPQPSEDERPPLDLALVIDASGSMNGCPLDSAKTAAVGVIQSLGDRDRVTIVTFASDIIHHVSSLPVVDGGRQRALEEVNDIKTRGCTNLHGGWKAGVRVLDDHRRNGAQTRIVILSDGFANRGVIDPEQLGLEAAAARTKGIYTTSVGIGGRYNATQLLALCENGGGNLHHAARDEEIVEVIRDELDQILSTVAEGMELRLELTGGVTATTMGPFPIRPAPGGATISVGGFVSGGRRRVPIRLTCPMARAGCRLDLQIVPTWRTPGDSAMTTGTPFEVSLLYAAAEEVATDLPDPDVVQAIARIWVNDLISRATAIVEENDRDAGIEFLKSEEQAFHDYVRDLPEGQDLKWDLRRYLLRLERPMSRRLLKEVRCHQYKKILMAKDSRRDLKFDMGDLESMD